MSTRCQIGFYESGQQDLTKFEALLYQHSDGYPSGVLPEVVPFLQWWDKARGISDLEYCAARLLQHLGNIHDNHMREYIKERQKLYPSMTVEVEDTGPTGTLGLGICKNFHGDIQYFYAVSPGELRVYDVPFDAPPEQWKLMSTIELTKEVQLDEVLAKLEG